MKRLLLISLIFSFPSFLCAKHCKILIPDTLIKQRIDYVDILSCCEGDGCNLVDIPRSDSISLIFYDYYESDDTTLYYGKEYDTYYYYERRGDTIVRNGYQNNFLKLHCPIIQIVLNKNLDDTLLWKYVGEGEYVHNVAKSIKGEVKMTQRGVKKLLLPDHTYENAFLVHSIVQHTENGVMSVIHNNRFYVPLFPYPLFESEQCYQEGELAYQVSYYSPITEEMMAKYLVIGEEEQSGEYQDEDKETLEQKIVQYGPNPVREKLNIKYQLNDCEDVIFKLFDSSSNLLLTQSFHKQAEGEYNVQLDMSSLHSGIYILYISVDTKIETHLILK